MNKATRILSNMSSDDCRTITTALGDISEHADLGTQAQYISDLLDYAETNDIPMQSVMYKCGGNYGNCRGNFSGRCPHDLSGM